MSSAVGAGIHLAFPGNGSEFPVRREKNTREASRIPGPRRPGFAFMLGY
jgi:hypothetical protein